jgi:hypothetical protein
MDVVRNNGLRYYHNICWLELRKTMKNLRIALVSWLRFEHGTLR